MQMSMTVKRGENFELQFKTGPVTSGIISYMKEKSPCHVG